jgi:hypothetical protein
VTGLLGFATLIGLVPAGVREGRRRWRMHLVGAGGPRAVSAAWQEVLAESADRKVVPPVGETVRATAQRLVDEHRLDESGQAGLRILVDAVERTWYASALDAAEGRRRGGRRPRGMNREVRAAMNAVLTSMVQSAPLTRTAQLLPRSVLRRPARIGTAASALRSADGTVAPSAEPACYGSGRETTDPPIPYACHRWTGGEKRLPRWHRRTSPRIRQR